MSRAVPRATGQPVGVRTGSSRPKPQRIDFDYLDGLSARAEREIRETEDALVAFIEAERKRETLYDTTTVGLEEKYPALKKEGVR